MTTTQTLTILEWIKAKIVGRIAIADSDANLLMKYAALPGDHVEIGCLWGGTAILSALAKREAGVDGRIYSIDFMTGGFWERGDPCMNRQVPTHDTILKNLKTFDVADRVTVIKDKSSPLPLNANVHPVTVLIDGDHSYEGCLEDWQNVKALKPDYVLFHDYNTGYHPGVLKVVDEVVKNDPRWREVECVNQTIVFERVK
jgi:cephalosporin hydroxylase